MKALVFDLDDTLYKEMDFVYGAFGEVAEYLSEKYKENRDEIFKKMVELLAENGRGRVFDDVCSFFNFDEEISKLVEVYRNATPNINIYGDAEYFLQKYKGKYMLGLITDGINYVQRNKIYLLGIEKYFDSIVVTDEYGKDCWKPSTKPYIITACNLGVALKDIIYIGDNPQKDFYGAKQLGVNTIRIIRDTGDHMGMRLVSDYEADREVASMYELEGIIEELKQV